MSVINSNELSLQLEQLITDLETFKSLLGKESTLLTQNQISEINKLSVQKQSLADRIDEKTTLVRDQYHLNLSEITPQTTRELSPTLQTLTNKIVAISNQCFQLNRKNGIIISALSHLNSELLKQLSPDENKINLYGATGKTEMSDTKKTLGTA